MKLNGAEVLVRCLKAQGVEMVFMKGHPSLALFAEALASNDGLKWIEPVSETSAVPMADAAARATGKLSAAISAAGGHALNQAVGIVSAWADKSPVLSISLAADPPPAHSPVFDREGFNQAEVFAAVTRFRARIDHWEEIPALIGRAARESMSGKGGPSHLSIGASVLVEANEISDDRIAATASSPRPQMSAPPRGDDKLVRAAFDLLLSAKTPLILAGAGAIKSEAVQEVNELARRLSIPIAATVGGMGAALPDNPSYFGSSSYLAGESFHAAIKRADVVLSFGALFSGLDGLGLPPLWSPKIKFIQVNIDPEDISLNPKASLAIVGDARQVARQMLDLLDKQKPEPAKEVKDWLALLRKMAAERLTRIADEAGRPWPLIHPASIPPLLDKIARPHDPLVVLDGGNTTLWAGILIPVPGPRRGFFPVGMGTLGLGLPAAAAVKAACPEKKVILVTGDGAFLYNVHELETLRRYHLSITIVIFNDSAWNMIRAGQAMTGEVYGTDLPSQDYAALARSYGLEARRHTKVEEIEPAFREAFGADKTTLLDIVTDPDSLPDSLISFARVEFAGTKNPPSKILGALKPGRSKLDIRLWNMIKFIRRTV